MTVSEEVDHRDCRCGVRTLSLRWFPSGSNAILEYVAKVTLGMTVRVKSGSGGGDHLRS